MSLSNNNNLPMASWFEPQFDPRLNSGLLYPTDHPEGIPRAADQPPSLRTGYSYSPRHSPNSSRPPYNLGLYGPRPQPSHSDNMQSLSTPVMAPPAPALTDLEEGSEYMEVEPIADTGEPIFESEYDDEVRSQGTRRFVGGFIRGLRKIPRVVKRGFFPDRREVLTPPGLRYHQSPLYTNNDSQPQDPEEVPPYDDFAERVEDDYRYTDTINMPAEFRPSASPSRTPSHSLRAPRSESQLTYQSLTNPPARHVSQHGSLHHFQRSSPPRTVRNPDPPSPTDESGTVNGDSPRPSHPVYETAPESAAATSPRPSPLGPARRPTVTVQSPTGSPIYIEPARAEDYVGMDMDESSEPTQSSEPPVSSQFARVAKFFRDLNNLPWVSPNVTVDFDPTEAERARQAHARVPGRSWYTGHLHDLDLLGGSTSTRRLTAPSSHSFGRAPGSSATLAPPQGSGSASSSEGASAHLPSAPTANPSYPQIPTLALPPQPVYLYPYAPMPQQPPPLVRVPDGTEQVSPQSSGHSDVPRQPYIFMVAMPPGYSPGPMDLSRSMQPAFSMPYPPPI